MLMKQNLNALWCKLLTFVAVMTFCLSAMATEYEIHRVTTETTQAELDAAVTMSAKDAAALIRNAGKEYGSYALFSVKQSGLYDFIDYDGENVADDMTFHDVNFYCSTSIYYYFTEAPAYETFYSQNYEGDGATVDWISTVSGRHTPTLYTDEADGNTYLASGAATRNNNGAIMYTNNTTTKGATATPLVAADKGDFTMSFDLRIGSDNKNGSSMFQVMDAACTNAIFSLQQTASYATTWKINSDANVVVTLPNSGPDSNTAETLYSTKPWYNFTVTLACGVTFLSIKDVAADTLICDKMVIPTLTGDGGVGRMQWASQRYNAFIAIDNVLVRSVMDTDYPAGSTPTTFAINYVDEAGEALKEARTGKIFAGYNIVALASDQDPIYQYPDGAETFNMKYIYKSGADTIVAQSDASQNVLNLVFRQAAQYKYTVMSSGLPEGYNMDFTPYDPAVSTKYALAWEGETYYFPYPEFILAGDSLWYSAPNGQEYRLSKVFTGAERPTIAYSDNYTALDVTQGADHHILKDIVFYGEGEEIAALEAFENEYTAIRCSKGAGGYPVNDGVITSLEPGTYRLVMQDRSGGNPVYTYVINETDTFSITGSAGTTTVNTSDEFTVAATSDLKIMGIGENTKGSVIDWIYIQKVSREETVLAADPAAYNVEINGTDTIAYTTNSTGTVTFASSDESVATVDANGIITGIADGKATITVTQAETHYYTAATATVEVTVGDPLDPSASGEIVCGYTAVTSEGTWTDLSDATQVNTETVDWTNDNAKKAYFNKYYAQDANGNIVCDSLKLEGAKGFPIGFTFNYLEQAFTNFAINANGFITLYKSGDLTLGAPNYWYGKPYSSSSAQPVPYSIGMTVDPYTQNDTTGSYKILYKTIETANGKELVVEFRDKVMCNWKGDPYAEGYFTKYSMQLHLCETGEFYWQVKGFDSEGSYSARQSMYTGLNDGNGNFVMFSNLFSAEPAVSINSSTSFSTTDSVANGWTVKFIAPEATVTPEAQATIAVGELAVNWEGPYTEVTETHEGADKALVLQSLNEAPDTDPVDGVSYKVGDVLGNATVIEAAYQTFLKGGENYFKAYACNAYGKGGAKYNTVNAPVVSISSFDPESAGPDSIVLVSTTNNSITLKAYPNANGDQVFVAMSETNKWDGNYGRPVIGTMKPDMQAGDVLYDDTVACGKIVYVGAGNEEFTIEGLNPAQYYHFVGVSKDYTGNLTPNENNKSYSYVLNAFTAYEIPFELAIGTSAKSTVDTPNGTFDWVSTPGFEDGALFHTASNGHFQSQDEPASQGTGMWGGGSSKTVSTWECIHSLYGNESATYKLTSPVYAIPTNAAFHFDWKAELAGRWGMAGGPYEFVEEADYFAINVIDGADTVEIRKYNESNVPETLLNSEWTKDTVDLAAYAGKDVQIQIVWNTVSSSTVYFGIEHVGMTGDLPTPEPISEARTWDFTSVYGSDAQSEASEATEYWGNESKGRLFYLPATNDEQLQGRDGDYSVTKGLYFTAPAATMLIGITSASNPYMQLGKAGTVIRIPQCKAGYEVTVTYSNATKSNTTGFIVTNGSVESFYGETAVSGVSSADSYTFTVAADGDVTLTTDGGKGTRVFTISVVDPATGISDINNRASSIFDNGAIYNLRGQKVENLKAGEVYIQNGKKFMVR